ncbi:hypothetical protein [Streptomyces sp. NPDC055189]
MRLVVTSERAETLDIWRPVFEEHPEVTFELASRSQTPVDAVMMAGIFAIERYGSRPNFRHAQILENHRGDGWHDLVIVPPTRPMTRNADGVWQVVAEYADIHPAYYAASHAFQAIAEWNASHDGRPINGVEINLPLMDMNKPVDESSPSAFKAALDDLLRDRT